MPKNSNTDKSKEVLQKKSSLEKFAINQNISIDEIRTKFPTIYAELTNKKMSMRIDEVEEETSFHSSQEGKISDPFTNYEPTIFDFLARARTNEEGLEIINFMEKQGQITAETAKELNKKIKTLGIRCFGPERPADYYHRKSEEIRTKKIIQKRYPFSKDNEQ
ncbi:MAG: DUF2095 family protein [Promethearchaeota archaeon]